MKSFKITNVQHFVLIFQMSSSDHESESDVVGEALKQF